MQLAVRWQRGARRASKPQGLVAVMLGRGGHRFPTGETKAQGGGRGLDRGPPGEMEDLESRLAGLAPPSRSI